MLEADATNLTSHGNPRCAEIYYRGCIVKRIIAGLIFVMLSVLPGHAQSCLENFRNSSGTYTTSAVFPHTNPAKALDNLARAGEASGFWVDIQVDRKAGIIRAQNDGAHNGRTQSVTVLVHREGSGTRVSYSIVLALMQFPNADINTAICRFLDHATD